MLKTLFAATTILAASVTATVPADAATLNFSFGLHGPNGGIVFGTPGHDRRDYLSPSKIRRELRNAGWDDVDVEGRFGNHYRVEAEWYGQEYELTVDAYTAMVVAYHPVGYPRFVPPPPPPPQHYPLVPPPWVYR